MKTLKVKLKKNTTEFVKRTSVYTGYSCELFGR